MGIVIDMSKLYWIAIGQQSKEIISNLVLFNNSLLSNKIEDYYFCLYQDENQDDSIVTENEEIKWMPIHQQFPYFCYKVKKLDELSEKLYHIFDFHLPGIANPNQRNKKLIILADNYNDVTVECINSFFERTKSVGSFLTLFINRSNDNDNDNENKLSQSPSFLIAEDSPRYCLEAVSANFHKDNDKSDNKQFFHQKRIVNENWTISASRKNDNLQFQEIEPLFNFPVAHERFNGNIDEILNNLLKENKDSKAKTTESAIEPTVDLSVFNNFKTDEFTKIDFNNALDNLYQKCEKIIKNKISKSVSIDLIETDSCYYSWVNELEEKLTNDGKFKTFLATISKLPDGQINCNLSDAFTQIKDRCQKKYDEINNKAQISEIPEQPETSINKKSNEIKKIIVDYIIDFLNKPNEFSKFFLLVSSVVGAAFLSFFSFLFITPVIPFTVPVKWLLIGVIVIFILFILVPLILYFKIKTNINAISKKLTQSINLLFKNEINIYKNYINSIRAIAEQRIKKKKYKYLIKLFDNLSRTIEKRKQNIVSFKREYLPKFKELFPRGSKFNDKKNVGTHDIIKNYLNKIIPYDRLNYDKNEICFSILYEYYHKYYIINSNNNFNVNGSTITIHNYTLKATNKNEE